MKITIEVCCICEVLGVPNRCLSCRTESLAIDDRLERNPWHLFEVSGILEE